MSDHEIYGAMDLSCEGCGIISILYHFWGEYDGDLWLCADCLETKEMWYSKQ